MSAPARIGAYPIEREIGRGGMGIVYLGRDTRLGRAVAIKVIPDAFAKDPERLSRFEREAKLLASLSHPNIAGIYGLEETDGHRFLVLEYIEGETLAARIARGALPVDDAVEIARQIAAALETAHENGVIHRDLKPGNVKLTPAGDVKVLDFGLAKGAGSAESSPDLSQSPTLTYAATGVGVILGTAAYMSPEQARGRVVDRRTDIWSFGCVLYECLTGRQLFSGETATDTIARILEREPDWNALPAETPTKIRDLLRRCLEKDPRKRLRDIGDARLELEESLAARTSESRIAAARTQSAREARRRSPALAYAIATLAVLVAAFSMLRPMMKGERPRAIRLSVSEPPGVTLSSDPLDCAISPDGQTLVFVGTDSSGNVQLWSRPLESLNARAMQETENAARPFWSPDSRWVGFNADGKLKKVRVSGGRVETICEAPGGRGGTWSPKGTIAFAPIAEGPLFAVSATGGKPRQVTTLDSTRKETAHRFPCFLPDGRHFTYVALPATTRGLQVWIGSVDGGKSNALMEADGAPIYVEPGYLIFRQDRNLAAQRFDPVSKRLKGDPITLPDTPLRSSMTGAYVATASKTGALGYVSATLTNYRLVWYDRSGQIVGTVPVAPARYFQPNISPDGRTVAVTRFTGSSESDVWLVNLDRGAATRFTFGPRSNGLGVWSRDGKRIAFEGSRNGPLDIFVKETSGALPEKPLVQGGSFFKHPTDWSPDDRLLLYYQMDPRTGFDIWVTPTDGSGPPRPYLQTPFHETFPSFSPDGRWVIYISDESGRTELYAQSFPDRGQKHQLTTTGCFAGGFRKDGREIFVGGAENTFYAMEVLEAGATLRTGPPRALFRVPATVQGGDATRDGQRFLLALPQGEAMPPSITVVLDWKAALVAGSDDRR